MVIPSTQSDELALPLPPKPLRVRVGATPDPQKFRQMGTSLAATVTELVAPLAGKRILEFGCGCGRVLAHSASIHPEAQWYGIDVDLEAIAWCRKHLADLARWEACEEWPPLPFADGTFDTIYQISVFTHLPPDMQLAWLDELGRVLADDGMMVVSIYNEVINAILPDSVRSQLEEDGIFYGNDGGTAGLPNSYQSCFHTPNYVRQSWTKRFEITAWHERAFCHSLDAIVLRKKHK